jgi:hypothetical protein
VRGYLFYELYYYIEHIHSSVGWGVDRAMHCLY